MAQCFRTIFSFQDNLRCFGVNYDMSRIMRFLCYFLSLKLASVLSYYAFPSLVLFSWSGLWCFCNSGYYKKERQLCVGRVRMQSRPFWLISHAAWIRTRPAGQRKTFIAQSFPIKTQVKLHNRGLKTLKNLVGRLQHAKTFWTEPVNRFCDKYAKSG